MTPGGDTRYTICTEQIEEFNVTGRWVFSRKTGENGLYRMRLDGSEIFRLSSIEKKKLLYQKNIKKKQNVCTGHTCRYDYRAILSMNSGANRT